MNINNLDNYIQEIYNDEIYQREIFNEELFSLKEEERNRILNEAIEFVNEAYVGKTPTLMKIEEQIGIIRRDLSRFSDFDSNKEVQKLNRLFEEQFGMDVFALHMDHHKIINAYTMALANNFDTAKNLDYTKWIVADRKNGYRFKPKNGFCISAVIYYGLLANPDFTDGEILAILLHELGHNFADFIDNKIRIANIDMMRSYEMILLEDAIIISILSLGILAPVMILSYKHKKSKFSNEKKRQDALDDQEKDPSKIKGGLEGIGSKMSDSKNTFFEVLSRISPLNRALNKWAASKRNNENIRKELRDETLKSLSRRNEIIADKFVGIYGYAYELGSALEKMRYTKTSAEKIVDKLPGGKKINRTWKEIYKDISDFDCHPHNIQRINENIKLLKDELDQADMDPKMKDAIKNQIKDLEKLNKQIAEKVKKNPDSIVAAYDAFVYKKLPDATTNKIEQEIADNYNKLLEKKK